MTLPGVDTLKNIAIVALIAVAAVQTVRLAHEQTHSATVQSQFDQAVALGHQATLAAERVQREIETIRQEKKDAIVEDARMEAKRISAAIAAGNAAGDGLQRDATDLAARACRPGPNAAPGPAGAPEQDVAAGVLADVLGRLERAGRVIAAEAATSRAAGIVCERSYDTLTP